MARFPFIFKAALPRFFFKLVPRWWSHLNQNAILEDDQIFLHKQERLVENERDVHGKSYAQACYMPTKADTYVVAFRRWISEMAGGHPAWPAGLEDRLPPMQTTREELLDRYHSHTAHCKSCATAMSNIIKIRKVLRVVSLVALAAAAGCTREERQSPSPSERRRRRRRRRRRGVAGEDRGEVQGGAVPAAAQTAFHDGGGARIRAHRPHLMSSKGATTATR